MSDGYSLGPTDLAGLKTVSLYERGGKVRVADFATVYEKGSGMEGLLGSLPHILAGDSFRAVVAAITSAQVRKSRSFGASVAT